jgi:hypothetical protein
MHAWHSSRGAAASRIGALQMNAKIDTLMLISVYAAVPARRMTSACCSRIASVNTSNPGMLRFSSSSTKPRRRRPSMSAAFWFRNEPPPKSLMSKRCSGLVSSSQSVADIFDAPLRFLSQFELRSSSVNDKLMEGFRNRPMWLAPNDPSNPLRINQHAAAEPVSSNPLGGLY